MSAEIIVTTCDQVWPGVTDVTRLQREIVIIKAIIFEVLDVNRYYCDHLWPDDNLSKLEQKYLTISPPQVHLMGFPSCLVCVSRGGFGPLITNMYTKVQAKSVLYFYAR